MLRESVVRGPWSVVGEVGGAGFGVRGSGFRGLGSFCEERTAGEDTGGTLGSFWAADAESVVRGPWSVVCGLEAGMGWVRFAVPAFRG